MADPIDAGDDAPPGPEPSAAEESPPPSRMGRYAVARARDGSSAFNTLRIGPRFCFSA